MAISALNSVSFSGGRRDNIDAFINLDDNAIRQVAMAKTRQNVDFDAHKKRNAALLLSLPIADGLRAAANMPKGLRMTGFAASTGVNALFWGGMLGTLGLINLTEKKNEKVANFTEKHPILTLIGSAITAYYAGKGLAVAGSKLFNKAINTKAFKSLSAKAVETFGKAKETKYIGQAIAKVQKGYGFVTEQIANLPSALKQTLKFAADWAPAAAIIGTLAECLHFSKTVNSEYAYNYNELKNKQFNLSKHRNVELAMQNDFLKTNPNNTADLKTVGL